MGLDDEVVYRIDKGMLEEPAEESDLEPCWTWENGTGQVLQKAQKKKGRSNDLPFFEIYKQ
ncbi:MAG: hypothetical protein AABY54_09280 [Deltaproteobacteria bacterium]